MDKKIKSLQLRLTPEEAAKFKEMAKDYESVSQYILCALKEFSKINAGLRFDIANRLGVNHRRCRDELSWASGNINQTIKRTSELVDAGKLYPHFLENVLLPEANKTMDLISEIKKKLDAATQKAIKLGLAINRTNKTDQPI